MVTREFAIKAAEGYRGLDGENENNTGNAFDGTKESYDREMWNALDSVSMLGEEAVNPSSIANAQLRVTSVFAEAGANKKGKAERGLSIEQMMLLEDMRELLSTLRDDLVQALERRDDLVSAQERHENGDFDPLNNEDDLKTLTDNGMTVELWQAMSYEEQAQWFVEQITAANQEVEIRQSLLERFSNDPHAMEFENGAFNDPDLEAARLQAQLNEGITIDPANLSEADILAITRALYEATREEADNAVNLEDANPDAKVETAQNDTFDSFTAGFG